jgi:hypothetical protein
MTNAAERVTGIAREKWSEKLGRGSTDDTAALENKLGQRSEQWPSDYGDNLAGAVEPPPSGEGLTADITTITADAATLTADQTVAA